MAFGKVAFADTRARKGGEKDDGLMQPFFYWFCRGRVSENAVFCLDFGSIFYSVGIAWSVPAGEWQKSNQ